MAFATISLPNGLDRADGVTLCPPGNVSFGTATPSNAVTIITPNGRSAGIDSGVFLEEQPDSPEIERAEQATIVHRFSTDWTGGKMAIRALGRGVYMQDSSGDVSRVLSSRLVYGKGGKCQLWVTAESLSFDNPPDEFDAEPQDVNPNIFKHPRYAELEDRDRDWINQSTAPGQPMDQNALWEQSLLANIAAEVDVSLSGDRLKEAWEVLNKLRAGTEEFFLSGFRINWSQYYYKPQALDPGAYRQDPVSQGGLPAYFWSTTQDETGQNVFELGAAKNPALWVDKGQGHIDWLRVADQCHFQRMWFRITRSWIGCPLGTWDKQLYTLDLPPGTNLPLTDAASDPTPPLP